MSKFIFILFSALAFTAQTTAAQTYTLTVVVQGFKNTKGTVKLNVQDANKKEVFQKVEALSATTYRLTITGLAKGQYAVNVFHDKNNNNKLDTNWMGIPKEGWGCSNDARGFMSAPAFRDKLITLDNNKTITINLVHY
jgi:uncharacterized protein (DUF2141 family)